MRQDINHREFYAKPDILGDDFALLFEAFAEAFRSMSTSSELDSHWSRLRSRGNC